MAFFSVTACPSSSEEGSGNVVVGMDCPAYTIIRRFLYKWLSIIGGSRAGPGPSRSSQGPHRFDALFSGDRQRKAEDIPRSIWDKVTSKRCHFEDTLDVLLSAQTSKHRFG